MATRIPRVTPPLLRWLTLKCASLCRFPHVFRSRQRRVRLWLASQNAAWQVGEVHRMRSRPSGTGGTDMRDHPVPETQRAEHMEALRTTGLDHAGGDAARRRGRAAPGRRATDRRTRPVSLRRNGSRAPARGRQRRSRRRRLSLSNLAAELDAWLAAARTDPEQACQALRPRTAFDFRPQPHQATPLPDQRGRYPTRVPALRPPRHSRTNRGRDRGVAGAGRI